MPETLALLLPRGPPRVSGDSDRSNPFSGNIFISLTVVACGRRATGVSGLRLFDVTGGSAVEIAARPAGVERDLQDMVETNMESLLGVRFLAREYSTGPVHGGRIDSLGLDENGAPVVVEFKRATDPGVLSQGLFYMAWLMDHRTEFQALVRERLGATAASQVLWSEPRLICVAGDFTRYDLHAVRECRRSIDLVRYRLYGDHLIALEMVASVAVQAKADRAPAGAVPARRLPEGRPGRWRS